MIERVNDVSLFLSTYLLFLWTDFIGDEELRYNIGSGQVLLIAVVITINLITLGGVAIKSLFSALKNKILQIR